MKRLTRRRGLSPTPEKEQRERERERRSLWRKRKVMAGEREIKKTNRSEIYNLHGEVTKGKANPLKRSTKAARSYRNVWPKSSLELDKTSRKERGGGER